VSTRVRSIEQTHAWAKAGVMIRENLTAGSPHVMLIVSPGKGIAMQYRRTQGGTSANVAIVPGTAPEWLRLTRDGKAILGEGSDDGLTWRAVGRIELGLSDFVTGGLVVTSHDNSTLATAVFDDVMLQR
jgi:regulation of enolase protein 1 (concanavalin A-like superfamily)